MGIIRIQTPETAVVIVRIVIEAFVSLSGAQREPKELFP